MNPRSVNYLATAVPCLSLSINTIITLFGKFLKRVSAPKKLPRFNHPAGKLTEPTTWKSSYSFYALTPSPLMSNISTSYLSSFRNSYKEFHFLVDA